MTMVARILRIQWATALLLFLCSHVVMGQADSRRVHDVVVGFFEALSTYDLPGMEKCVTADFTLLEDGVIWTMDTVAALTGKPRAAGFKRLNHFDFFETMVKKDMAFVSYHNMAEITTTTGKRTVKWLESAVLVKEGKHWKIRMMHSTRLE